VVRKLRLMIDIEGPLSKFTTFAYSGSLIGFGYIARLSQWGRGGILLFKLFLPALAALFRKVDGRTF
jgi:hypothetical protein